MQIQSEIGILVLLILMIRYCIQFQDFSPLKKQMPAVLGVTETTQEEEAGRLMRKRYVEFDLNKVYKQ